MHRFCSFVFPRQPLDCCDDDVLPSTGVLVWKKHRMTNCWVKMKRLCLTQVNSNVRLYVWLEQEFGHKLFNLAHKHKGAMQGDRGRQNPDIQRFFFFLNILQHLNLPYRLMSFLLYCPLPFFCTSINRQPSNATVTFQTLALCFGYNFSGSYWSADIPLHDLPHIKIFTASFPSAAATRLN